MNRAKPFFFILLIIIGVVLFFSYVGLPEHNQPVYGISDAIIRSRQSPVQESGSKYALYFFGGMVFNNVLLFVLWFIFKGDDAMKQLRLLLKQKQHGKKTTNYRNNNNNPGSM